ncbi:MAG: S1 RNA-binding domain-containing protein [Oligosphaeraceae bacterium]|nr:S1 RNA-binding domain-containing protein [Oligosphaeraceae bacterium]
MELNAEKDFGSLFEAVERQKVRIRPGEKVSGRVIMIDDKTVFVDLGARADGYLDRNEFADGKGGITVIEGDVIDAFCMGWTDDGIKLQLKMSSSGSSEHETDASVEDAFNSGMPIEGKVTGERKGGYTVQISHTEAFCPFSQIDGRGIKKEPAEYIGKAFLFKISEYSEGGRNVVLSRRQLLDQEAAKNREALKAALKEGDLCTGQVVKIMPFGAFVDLGGVEGMVHVSEISPARVEKPEDILSVGQEVTVKILKLAWSDGESKERISLSIKQAAADPWESIPGSPEFGQGCKRQGKVVRIADFGVFVELAPGVDGLAHISQLGADHRVAHPSEVVQEGDLVEVTILGVDLERRRISLCLGDPKEKEEAPAQLSLEEERQVISAAVAGQTVTGEVDSQKPFGLFVKLPNGQTGLLHISQIPLAEGNGIPIRQLYRQYPLHSQIEVVVRSVEGKRISLTLPETLEMEKDRERTTLIEVKDSNDSNFGSLGDLFGGLKL